MIDNRSENSDQSESKNHRTKLPYILELYFAELQKLTEAEQRLQATDGASEDVQELRFQLRQLTEEIHSLRTNLNTSPQSSMRHSLSSLTSGIPSPQFDFAPAIQSIAEEEELKPPLPPRKYHRNGPVPPVKPQRTFEHTNLSLSTTSLPCHPISPIYRLPSATTPYRPPILPPKSGNLLQKKVTGRSESLDFVGLFSARPVITNGEGSKTPSPRSTLGLLNGHLTPPRSADYSDGMQNGGQINLFSELRAPFGSGDILKQIENGFIKGTFWFELGPVRIFVNPFNDLSQNAISRQIPQSIRSLAQELYTCFHESDASQSIVLSGESGSGKTYIAIQLLKQLFSTFGSSLESDSFSVLSTSTSVLRSFACTKTSANNRASRIGFLYEMHINDGLPKKTNLSCLFTDLQRLVSKRKDSQNFDIFYEMLAGLTQEERVKFHLDNHDDSTLNYLSSGRQCTDDERRFGQWRWALGALGIPFSDVMRILSAILLLGNVKFEQDQTGELEVSGQTELESVAALLGLSGLTLYKALVRRSKCIKGQFVKMPSSSQLANEGRDVLAKTLYYRCVISIIRRINSIQIPNPVRPQQNNSSGVSSSDGESSVHDSGIGMTRNISPGSTQTGDGVISIVDLFGFTAIDENLSTFEDLCVNLTSERLRHFYQTKMFARSQQIMLEEGVTGYEIEFEPDQTLLDAFMIPKFGLLCILDNHCSDVSKEGSNFAQVMKNCNKFSSVLHSSENTEDQFVVRHYGGRKVTYDSSEFVSLNRNDLSVDLTSVFSRNHCNFGFASYLFSPDSDSSCKKSKIVGGTTNGPNSEKGTFSQDFMFQLDSYFNSLNSTHVHFVHCMKPNDKQEFQQFDKEIVKKQLQRLDLMPTAHLACAGLPYCMTFEEFNNRYRFISARYNKENLDLDSKSQEETKVILDCYLRAVDDSNLAYVSNQWSLGTKHILLSQGAYQQLQLLKNTGSQFISQNSTPLSPQRLQKPSPVIESTKRTVAPPNRSTSLLSVDMNGHSNVPPPLPPPRQYVVSNGRKTPFPQRRVMVEPFNDGISGVNLRPGDIVTVRGFGNRMTHFIVDVGNGHTISVPSMSTRLCMR